MRVQFIALCAVGLAGIASGQTASFIGSDAFGRHANVSFTKSGTDLVVVLTNDSPVDVLVPVDVLTAVFWSMDNMALDRISAVLSPLSFVIYDDQPVDGVVGGEWAYKGGLNVRGRNFTISSSGLGIVGPGDRFPGPDLAAPDSPDGLQYGLTSAGDNPATGNGGITGTGGLIKNSVTFTLRGLAANFDIHSIHDIQFQYGTALDEPHTDTPTPGALSLVGVAAATALRRRR